MGALHVPDALSRTLGLSLLAVIACVAMWLRLEAGAAGKPTEEEARALRAGWLVDDGATALHLRRIELALAGGAVPHVDRYLEHPELGEVRDLPLFDTLLAAGAQRALTGTSPDTELRGVDEAALEHWMSDVNPWLAIALVVATYWAARAFASAWPALAAAAFVAACPPVVMQGAAGRLDAHVFAATCVALAVGCLARGLRAREPLDSVTAALIMGGAFGVASAASFTTLCAFPVLWAVCAWTAYRGAPELRGARLRTGLCFCAVAALTNQMFLVDVASGMGTERVLASVARASSFVMLLGALPFLAGSLARGELTRKPLHWIVLIGGSAALAYAASDTAREVWRLRGVIVEQGALGSWASCVTLAAIGAGLLIAWSLEAGRITKTIAIATGVVLALLAASAWLVTRSHNDHRVRAEMVRGLRWMRENTPPAGAWNSAAGMTDFGVLADPRAGALIAYHARRPAVCSDAVVGSERRNGPRVVAALESGEVDDLARAVRVLEARYVVVSPLYLTERTPADALAFRSSIGGESELRSVIADCERVYTSPLKLGIGGREPQANEPAGPALTIYLVARRPSASDRDGGFAPK